VGSITVNAAPPPNSPPTISIGSPASGKVFSAPANVKIQTTPADSDGTVTNVQFRLGATILGNVAVQPFSLTASNLAAADYVISAVVSDNQGAKATNSVTIHVINPNPVAVTSPMMASPGSFQFGYSTDLGLNYVIEVSPDLFNWTPIGTNTSAASNPAFFTDTNAPVAGAYYRVGRMPNP
jgi:chitinase